MMLQLPALFALLLRPALIPWVVPVIAAFSLWAIVDYTLYLARVRTK